MKCLIAHLLSSSLARCLAGARGEEPRDGMR